MPWHSCGAAVHAQQCKRVQCLHMGCRLCKNVHRLARTAEVCHVADCSVSHAPKSLVSVALNLLEVLHLLAGSSKT
jgi:hypothetical protein